MLDFPKGNNKNRKGARRTQLKWWLSPMERLSCEWNSLPSVHKRFARKSRQLVKFFSFFPQKTCSKISTTGQFFSFFLFFTCSYVGQVPGWKIKHYCNVAFFICLPLPSGSLCKECLSLLASPEFSWINCFLDSPKTTLDSECNNPFKFIFNHFTSEDVRKTILLAPLHQKLCQTCKKQK